LRKGNKRIMEKGDSWYTIECECPYCGSIQDGQDSDIQICERCGKEFEINEPTL